MNVHETELSNGVRVATAAMPHVESVALGLWIGVGGRYESKTLSGMSHFIEHLLFKGTRKRSAREISEAIEGKGGYFNAFTQEESTCYYARVASAHTWDVFEILADMYLNPKMDAGDINRERGVIVEEIMMYRDQPQHFVQERLGELLWSHHPLGRPLIGTPENILNVKRAQILGFKKEYYVPNNTVVVLAGKVDHDTCVKEVQKILGRSKGGKTPSQKKVTPKTRQHPVDVLSKDIEQTHLAIGFRLFGRRDPRRYSLKLLSVVLGENMSSRLFQVIREKHGLAYSIHSSVQLFEETGVFVIQAGLDKRRTRKAIQLIFRELQRILTRGLGPRELQRAKDYAMGQIQIGLESTTSQMMWVGENYMGYGKYTSPDLVLDRLSRVREEDILKIARSILKGEKASIAMMIPEAKDDWKAYLNEQCSALRYRR